MWGDALVTHTSVSRAAPVAGAARASERKWSTSSVVGSRTMRPRAPAYRPASRAVSRLVFNLNSPVFLANDVFQGRFEAAGITLWRFTINTTVGIGGLLDVGAWLDVPGHRSDFGQTLALWGVGSGPYLIVPVLGPTTVRDGFGSMVDLLLRPTTYLLAPADQLMFTSIHGGGSGLALRESSIEGLRALRSSSVDFYAALRSAYFQNRMAEIEEHSK